jgi:hypothetical protein
MDELSRGGDDPIAETRYAGASGWGTEMNPNVHAAGRALVLSALLGAIVEAAVAAAPVVPGNPNPPAESLMKRPGTLGVFQAQSDGSIRHLQSGFVCPASLPNVNFWGLQVIPSPLGPGTDVGCDYGRMWGGQIANGPEAKLTIYVVKAQARGVSRWIWQLRRDTR